MFKIPLTHGRLQALLAAAGAGHAAVTALVGVGPAAGQTGDLIPKQAANPYVQAVLADHPVGYWRLDEHKGTTKALDDSGHNRNGKYHGKPHLGQPGAFAFDKNTAVGFDGPKSKSYVEIPANKHFSVATSGKGLTVEVWMRPDALTFQPENKDKNFPYIHWLGKGEAGEFEWGFRFYSDEGKRPNRISAYIWNPEGKEGAGAYFEDKLTKHQWMHIVATYDDPGVADPRVRIYKNGAPSAHNNSSGTLYKSFDVQPVSGKAPVRLGTRDLAGFLTGGLDEVAIYPQVLTPEEILHHWRVGSGAKHPE